MLVCDGMKLEFALYPNQKSHCLREKRTLISLECVDLIDSSLLSALPGNKSSIELVSSYDAFKSVGPTVSCRTSQPFCPSVEEAYTNSIGSSRLLLSSKIPTRHFSICSVTVFLCMRHLCCTRLQGVFGIFSIRTCICCS